MAAIVRAMTLGQNYHHHHQNMNSCVIVASPDTPPPSSAGSPPLIHNNNPMQHTMIGKRTIAPAMLPHHQQQHQQQQVKGGAPVIRFNGSDVKNICAAKNSTKRLNNHLPQYPAGPMPSVERRNARERNRVKQVNNGFEKLRQYIPAKIVEVENGGRGVSKKLSKVDTLKLAVKYIQRLKEMLDDNNSRMPQSNEVNASSTSSYYSASPAPSSHHHPMYMAYASTPNSNYQENHHQIACSEPSVSPAPSAHSDISSHHPTTVYQMQNVQFSGEEAAAGAVVYPKGYSQAQFEDEDSGSFEEDGILDDILQWQLQN